MIRTASAVWNGAVDRGSGAIEVGSGVLGTVPYSFAKRFGDEPGTNPEELIAAAHAACFTMALSFGLGQAGFTPEKLETKATLEMGSQAEGWLVKTIHLAVQAHVPGIEHDAFQDAAQQAKDNCPISRLLNTQISLEAALES